MATLRGLVLLVLSLLLIGAGPVKRSSAKRYEPRKVLTTWYADPARRRDRFHGRRTASGEIMDGMKLTAAHRTLPLGTILSIKNPKNGKSVTVRVNDRGPYSRAGLDISYKAAKDIGLIQSGSGVLIVEKIGEREG